jgi:TolB protein
VFECRFTSSAGPGSYEICLINADGTGFVRLTVDGAVDTSPAWSPDGTRIAFSSNRFGPKVEILFMDSAGDNVTRLTPGFAPSWWPDGSKLVLSNDDGLFTIRPDGSGLTRLTTGRHSRATIRP